MKQLKLVRGTITSIANTMPWHVFNRGIGITLDTGDKVMFEKLTSVDSIFVTGFDKKHVFCSETCKPSLNKNNLCIAMSILLVELNCNDLLDLLGKRITVFMENKKVTMITVEGAYD